MLTLALNSQIDFISPDRQVRLLGHLSTTTGANAASTSVGRSDLDGSGVGIAILIPESIVPINPFSAQLGFSRRVEQRLHRRTPN